MDYSYRMRTDIIFDEDGKDYLVYGIEAVNDAGILIRSVSDIFFDYDRAREFVNLCNTCELSLIHLMDVIDDALV